MLHDGLEELVFVLPVKRRLKENKQIRIKSLNMNLSGNWSRIMIQETAPPVLPASHTAAPRRPTSPLTFHKAGRL